LENWEDEDISNQFKENIGFTKTLDKMPLWEKKYSSNHIFDLYENEYETVPSYWTYDDDSGDTVCLGKRYKTKTRSLKKNKGCTLEDMEKLIGEVLRFGAGIPDCELRNEEQRGFDKYYGVKE
jgi:hypothetical protein